MSHERRIFETFEIGNSETQNIELSKDNSNHLIKVLRLKVGDEIVVVEKNSARSFSATISSVSPTLILLKYEIKNILSAPTVLSLCLALCKGDTTDFICEKATELGVNQIVFWESSHSILKYSSAKKRIERWNKIVEAASKQSGRVNLPSIHLFGRETSQKNPTMQLIEFINSYKDGVGVYASLGKDALSAKDLVQKGERYHLIIGPEGDFTMDEELVFKENNFKKLSLGSLRLRSETAAIAGIVALNSI